MGQLKKTLLGTSKSIINRKWLLINQLMIIFLIIMEVEAHNS